MDVSRPISVHFDDLGIAFAESRHSSHFQMAERVDSFDKLLYVLVGSVEYHSQMAPPCVISAGSILAVPSGLRHRLVDIKRSTLLILCLREEFYAEDGETLKVWKAVLTRSSVGMRLDGRTARRVESHWRRGLAEQLQDRPGRSLLVRAEAYQALSYIARLSMRDSTKPAEQRAAEVCAEVDATFFEDWSVDRAAQRAGLSRRRFSALFRKATGCSFAQYVLERRLVHASELLRRRTASITGAIFASGFNDVAHFYRTFRRRFGDSPARWLENEQR